MPTIFHLAQIANDVYENSGRLPAASGITRQSQSGPSTSSGFFAAVYRCGTAPVVAFTGTNDASDAITDAMLYSSFNAQLPAASSYIEQLVTRGVVEPGVTSITGHSLGGALATYAALYLARAGRPPRVTVSFNGPNLRRGAYVAALTGAVSALSPAARRGLATRSDMPRGAREAGCLLNVRVAADVVSRIGVPMGHTVVLETPASCRSPTSTAERVLSVVSPVAGLVVEGARGATVTVRAHLMTAVIEALGSRRSLADQDAHAYTSRLGPAPGWSVGDFF